MIAIGLSPRPSHAPAIALSRCPFAVAREKGWWWLSKQACQPTLSPLFPSFFFESRESQTDQLDGFAFPSHSTQIDIRPFDIAITYRVQ